MSGKIKQKYPASLGISNAARCIRENFESLLTTQGPKKNLPDKFS